MSVTLKEKVVHKANSFNISVDIPTGKMYVVIQEDEEGNPYRLDVHIGKAGSAQAAWCGAVCDMIGKLWSLGVSTAQIISTLNEYRAEGFRTTEKGTRIYSGPHGIGHALLIYMQWKGEIENVESRNSRSSILRRVNFPQRRHG